jgi:hypothetical protein
MSVVVDDRIAFKLVNPFNLKQIFFMVPNFDNLKIKWLNNSRFSPELWDFNLSVLKFTKKKHVHPNFAR